MSTDPHILCVNPWIHDFAAYDFWARPLGLLCLAGLLRESGCRVSYIDCLDRFHPRAPRPNPEARCGRGPYRKTPITRPAVLSDVPRRYSRYGIDPEWLVEDLQAAGRPELVLVTSMMTYWYPGVAETIRYIRSVFPHVPVVLGGVYAALYPMHARRKTGADRIVSGPGEDAIFTLVGKYTGKALAPGCDLSRTDALACPAFDLQHAIPYVPVLTSRGCPFSCDYCASSLLSSGYRRREPLRVFEEIAYWHRSYGVRDFAFYDDALLVDAENHADVLFSRISGSKMDVRLHTPNALHVRNISRKTAFLMRAAGMTTVRLGVETADFKGREMDRKIGEQEFFQAAAYLKEAGFSRRELGAYLLAGLPGQDPAQVERSIDVVKASGMTPVIAYYSPIAGTKMWDAARAASRYDLDSDPIFTNNAVMPCQAEFSWDLVTRLKNRVAA